MSQTKLANSLKKLPLTIFEKEVVAGCLLGDGSLMKSGKHYRLRINYTIRHWEYVNWKYELIKRICVSLPNFVPANSSVRVGTIGHPDLSVIREIWYREGFKEIPNDFRLTPLALAIWFQDDGTKQGRSVDFSVHCFSKNSLAILQKELFKLSILSTINFDGKGNRLYIRRKSLSIFENLVKPYIQKCMAYKLP